MKSLKHQVLSFLLFMPFLCFGQFQKALLYYPEFNALMNPSHSSLLERASIEKDGNFGIITPSLAGELGYLAADREPLLGRKGDNNYILSATFGLDLLPYYNNSITDRSKPGYRSTMLLSVTMLSERYTYNAVDGGYLSFSYKPGRYIPRRFEFTFAGSIGILQHRIDLGEFPRDSLGSLNLDQFFEVGLDHSLAIKIGYNSYPGKNNRPTAHLSFALPSNRQYAQLIPGIDSKNSDFLFLSEFWVNLTATESYSLEMFVRTLHEEKVDGGLGLRNGIIGAKGRVSFFGFPVGLEAMYDWKDSNFIPALEVPIIFFNPDSFVYGKKNHFRHLRLRLAYENKLDSFSIIDSQNGLGRVSLMYGAY